MRSARDARDGVPRVVCRGPSCGELDPARRAQMPAPTHAAIAASGQLTGTQGGDFYFDSYIRGAGQVRRPHPSPGHTPGHTGAGLGTATPIQSKVIPLLREGRDLVG